MSLAPGALLEVARQRGELTQASLCVVRDGVVLLQAGDESVYDIASVTKAVTAVAVLQHLDPSQSIDWLQGAPTVEALLSHGSGLPAWRPLFALAALELGVTPAALVTRPELHAQVRAIYRRLISETRPDAARPTYSDLGFLALGFALEERGALPELLGQVLCGPGGLNTSVGVSTGAGRPRAGNPPVESEAVARAGVDREARDAAPDDDNAACAGGLCGHAGLFATAHQVALLGDRLRRDALDGSGGLLPASRAIRLFERVCGDRTLGLDTPSGATPSIGTRLGRGPLGAAGHLGFTGCSLWIDRDARLSIALLTDGVSRARPAVAMRSLRPAVHDAVAEALGIAPPDQRG